MLAFLLLLFLFLNLFRWAGCSTRVNLPPAHRAGGAGCSSRVHLPPAPCGRRVPHVQCVRCIATRPAPPTTMAWSPLVSHHGPLPRATLLQQQQHSFHFSSSGQMPVTPPRSLNQGTSEFDRARRQWLAAPQPCSLICKARPSHNQTTHTPSQGSRNSRHLGKPAETR
jgi:hypothetical protein